jgi:putative transposase
MNHLSKSGCIFQNKAGEETCEDEIDENSKYFCKKHIGKSFKYKNTKSKIDMRKHILKKDVEEWKKDLPFDSKTLTINNAIESQKAAISNMKNGNIKSFNMGFRTRKDKTQIMKVDYRALKIYRTKSNTYQIRLFDGSMWKGFSDIKIKNKKDLKWLVDQFTTGPKYFKKHKKRILLKTFIPCDFAIKYEESGKYYLCIPSYRDGVNEKAPYEIVSLDPGIRTFQTFYSPEGIVGKIGENTVEQLARIGERIDRMQSHADKETNISLKTKIKKRCTLLRTKIKNTVKDLHWKTASYLCENFDKIIIPSFEVQQMTTIGKRKINSTSVRKMLSLSHYQFKQRLQCMATYYGRKVYICDESYTSKTCGNCGFLDDKLGGKKEYICKTCGVNIDRDVNGARNVLLRQLSGLSQ